jgi:hypothetical protein
MLARYVEQNNNVCIIFSLFVIVNKNQIEYSFSPSVNSAFDTGRETAKLM